MHQILFHCFISGLIFGSGSDSGTDASKLYSGHVLGTECVSQGVQTDRAELIAAPMREMPLREVLQPHTLHGRDAAVQVEQNHHCFDAATFANAFGWGGL